MKAITTRYTVRRNRGAQAGTTTAGYTATDGDGNTVFVAGNEAQARGEFNLNKLNSLETNHRGAALALCDKMGWKGDLAGGHLLKGGKTVSMVWVWTGSAYPIVAHVGSKA